ncbi:general stress protein [Terrabacter terrigena]|uniref:General stress protein n=1 Tax=Terrabacter terrigena TaxID=574718 RepID=A0ABW3MYV6_9MICO
MTDPVTQTGADPAGNDPSTRVVTPVDPARTLGSNPPTTHSRPVGQGDQAVIAVFPDLAAAEQAVIELAQRDFPVDRISIVGKDMQSEVRISGFVTTGDLAGPSAATGAWVGGLFGVLSGAAMLFIPGLGPLVVLGPLAAAAVGAAEGALLGGAVGVLLGHFVAKSHLPKYEELVRTGSYLLVVHGTEEEVARAQGLLAELGSTDVQRHDEYRGPVDRIGPIEKVYEGMAVVDVNGEEVGKVEFVKLGDPQAISIQDEGPDVMPDVPRPFAERLLLTGFLKVDRKGLFARDAYVSATEVDVVEDGTVRLNVSKDMLLTKRT